MYFARAHGADLLEYHRLMYRAALIERADIEDPAVVARAAAPLLDAGALEQALRGGRYERELQKANAYAFDRSGVWAVPAYRMDGRRPVSYTHLDVYKRQQSDPARRQQPTDHRI